jgi:hypothetical protein
MKKVNRKLNSADQKSMLPKIVAGIVLFLAAGYFYLNIHDRCEKLGGEIKKLESVCENNKTRVANEEAKWAVTISPRSIEQALVRHSLTLSWPKQGQVVRIYDSRASDLALVDTRDAVRFAQLERMALNE